MFILTIILLVALLILAAVAVRLFIQIGRQEAEYRRREKEIIEGLETYRLFVVKFQKRVSLLHRHASQYMNSLTLEASEALLKMRRIITSQEKLISEIETSVKSGDYEKFPQNELIVSVLLSYCKDSDPDTDTPLDPIVEAAFKSHSIEHHWERDAERLIQMVGKQVYQASHEVGKLIQPSGEKKASPTFTDLREAGIEGLDQLLTDYGSFAENEEEGEEG